MPAPKFQISAKLFAALIYGQRHIASECAMCIPVMCSKAQLRTCWLSAAARAQADCLRLWPEHLHWDGVHFVLDQSGTSLAIAGVHHGGWQGLAAQRCRRSCVDNALTKAAAKFVRWCYLFDVSICIDSFAMIMLWKTHGAMTMEKWEHLAEEVVNSCVSGALWLTLLCCRFFRCTAALPFLQGHGCKMSSNGMCSWPVKRHAQWRGKDPTGAS